MKKVCLLALLLASCGDEAPKVEIRDAWARPTLTAAQSGVVYLTITNNGGAADRLESVEVDGGEASLHSSTMTGGVMRMREVSEGLPIPAHSTVALEPNGTHIMLEKLGAPLRAGSRFPITLHFDKSGDRQATVAVAADAMDMHAHGH
jgi:copper(I)-binding protein